MSPRPALQDNLPAPRFDPLGLSVYVDNFATIGTNAHTLEKLGTLY